MNRIKWTTLTIIAGSSGLALAMMVKLLDGKREEFARNAPFLDTAVNILRSKPQVMKLLGDELEVGHASFHDGWSKTVPLGVQLRVPIKGTEDQGHMYTYAKMFDEKSSLRLCRLEVTFDKIKDKRLLLLDLSDEQLEKMELAERREQEPLLLKHLAKPEGPNKSDYHTQRIQQALANKNSIKAE